jgi:uncharacterized membrane protein YphA (DoxX/SURF4 family)
MKKPRLYASTSPATRFFLVLLRLAIGWHLFIEGASKLETFSTGPTGTTKPFSSRGYLQQSQGPLGKYFRQLAGDPDQVLLPKLDISTGGVPTALQTEWADYVRRYSEHYQLQPDQRTKADELLKQHLDKLAQWFKPGGGTKTVSKDYSFASITPTVDASTRIKEYRDKLKELSEKIDAWNLRFDKDVTKARITTLRGEVARLRVDLQKDLDEQQEKLSQDLDKLLTKQQLGIDSGELIARLIRVDQGRGYTADHQALADLIQIARETKSNVVTAADWSTLQRYPADLISEFAKDPEYDRRMLRIAKRLVAPPLHVEDTRMLDLADRTVAWGLTICGLGLLLGCFSRLSALGGACLLLLFYISLPPLPGLPDNPMAEGKYLFVNKNLIEALALLALATTASGRWFGVDGLLSLLPPFCYLWPKPKLVVEVSTHDTSLRT